MAYEGDDRRASVLTKDDILQIADAVTERAKTTFHIDEEKHYNQHTTGSGCFYMGCFRRACSL